MAGAVTIDLIRSSFTKYTKGRRIEYFATSFTSSLKESGLPEAFAWLEGELCQDNAQKSKHNGSIKTAQNASLVLSQKDLRAPDVLSAKLDEWVSRAEKDSSSQQLLDQFYSFSLPSWDHYIHIRVAYVLLTKHGRKDGLTEFFSQTFCF